jgi:hypothetical protein
MKSYRRFHEECKKLLIENDSQTMSSSRFTANKKKYRERKINDHEEQK